MTDPKLSIIMVSYNTADMTCRALASVFEQTKQTDFECIVVDNDSQDDSVSKISQQFPQVQLIEAGNNDGFAAGVMRGAAKSQGQYLLLLNPDTVILNGAIDRLLACAKTKPENGIWGGVTLNNDGSLNSQHAWTAPNAWNLFCSALGLSKLFAGSCIFNQANYGCWDRNTDRAVDIISGCFFLTRKSLWDQLGGLDPHFFMYAEEADYCLRAQKIGYRPWVCSEARIVHHGGASLTFAAKQIRLLKGKIALFKRHQTAPKVQLYTALLKAYVANKYWSHRILKPHSGAYTEWQKVWQARSDWLQGY